MRFNILTNFITMKNFKTKKLKKKNPWDSESSDEGVEDEGHVWWYKPSVTYAWVINKIIFSYLSYIVYIVYISTRNAWSTDWYMKWLSLHYHNIYWEYSMYSVIACSHTRYIYVVTSTNQGKPKTILTGIFVAVIWRLITVFVICMLDSTFLFVYT